MAKPLLPEAPILLVDDEEQALVSYDLNLRYQGLTNTIRCPDGRRAKAIIEGQDVSMVMLDLCMPHLSGEELLGFIRDRRPGLPVIVVTGDNEVETAVRCMRAGSLDYLVKPVDRDRLLPAVKKALELRRACVWPRDGAARAPANSEVFAHMVSRSRAMADLYRTVDAVARTAEPVFITGETGVGKEMLARAIHLASRRQGPFVAVNAAGLDDTMFADALFGHVRGAFTGAGSSRAGLVERAAGGSLFLDEIGDLSHASQLKLLRLLQEREYYPLGSDAAKHGDARVIVATNQPLEALLDPAVFRRDLYFRLRTHHLPIPPLRERRGDIPLLVAHFLDEASKKLGLARPDAPEGLMDLLAAYPFPGNIRELEAMVFDAVARGQSGRLSLEVFRGWMASGPAGAPANAAAAPEPARSGLHLPTLREAEEDLIEEALKRCDGNQAQAAAFLGISRQALNRRLLTRKKKGAAA